MSAQSRLRIGLDVGGSKISGLLLAGEGEARRYLRQPTPRNDYHATLNTIQSLIDQLSEGCTPHPSIGIGIPGSLNPETGKVRNANSTWLNGRALQTDLEQTLARPVRLANDADCFALSEATDGAGQGARTVWGIILGTGCGSGIVLQGALHQGPLAIAGEWGHNPLPPEPGSAPDRIEPEPCWCGRQGCIESWLSGPAIAADHLLNCGEVKTATEIFAAATNGDQAAAATLARHRNRLARAMAAAINILDPNVVVLGGGVGSQPLIYQGLEEAIKPNLFTDAPSIAVRPPLFGDDSGVRGAARLWSLDAAGEAFPETI